MSAASSSPVRPSRHRRWRRNSPVGEREGGHGGHPCRAASRSGTPGCARFYPELFPPRHSCRNLRTGIESPAMRAATIRDGEVLVEEHPDPEPGKGEILVRVRAAGINGGDLHQRAGRYPAPPGWPPDIPGMELAGEVVGRGPGAERFEEGDARVLARRRRRPGRAGGGARARRDAGAGRARLARGRRVRRGVHDGARRPVHPGGARRGRAAARPRRRRWRRHGGDPARPRRGRVRDGDGPATGAARRGVRPRRRGGRPRRLHGRGAVRRGARADRRRPISRATCRPWRPAAA